MTIRLNVSIVMFVLAMGIVPHAHALDTEAFLKVARDTLKAVKKVKIKDVDSLIEKQKELIRLGVEGCLEFAEKSPNDAKMMQLIVLNSLKMQTLSLDEIEREWLEGGYLKSHGINVDKFAQTDVQVNHYDSIVNPATAIIALTEYKKSQDPQLLNQVHETLSEVVHQVEGMK